MKRELTVSEKEILSNGCLGMIWVVVGIGQFFQSNKIVNVLAVIFLTAGLILTFVPFFVKAQEDDEMSKYNMNKTKVHLYELIIMGITICTLIISLKGRCDVDLKMVMPFILGGIKIFESMLFVFYEKAGA